MKHYFTKILSPVFVAVAMIGEGAAASGGPDAFGYEFRDSAEADGPAFEWIDISTSGSVLIAGATTVAEILRLRRSWTFYGEKYRDLRVSRNGFLTTDLSDPGGDETNDANLPQAPSQGGGSRIYVLHDSLRLDSASGRVFYEYFPTSPHSWSSAGVHVISWQNVHHSTGDTRRFAFQALLFDTGEIMCQFPQGNPERGTGSTTGIQDDVSASGLGAYINRLFSQRRTIVFSIPPQLILPVPEVDARSGYAHPELVDVGGLFGSGVTDYEIAGSSFVGGTLAIDPSSGVVSFTPPAGFLGGGTIDVSASNPTGTVTITIPVNVHSVIHVTPGADPANSSFGLTWTNPTNLHRALFLSNATTHIWIKNGLHYPDEGQGTTPDDRQDVFVVANHSTVIGGFTGTESLAGERVPGNGITVLSGDITQNDATDLSGVTTSITSPNSYSLFAVGNTFRLEDCTITGFSTTFDEDDGVIEELSGGVPDDQRKTTLRRCLFATNFAPDDLGQLVVLSATTALIEECTFRDGKGGIEITNTNGSQDRIVIQDCIFENLEDGFVTGVRGTDFIRCTFRNLTNGGLQYMNAIGGDELIKIENCLFENIINDAANFVFKSPVSVARSCEISGSRFVDNDCPFDGGAVTLRLQFQEPGSITHCQFVGNTAEGNGGALSLLSLEQLRISECLFVENESRAGNSGKGGGALYIDGSAPIGDSHLIIGCTFAQNSAQNLGAAIYSDLDAGALSSENCIFWENDTDFVLPASLMPDDFVTKTQLDSGSASGISFAHCLLQGSGGSSSWTVPGGTDLGGNLDDDPLFLEAGSGDYRLGFESPATNAGLLFASTRTDLAGAPRQLGAGQDIGAYETMLLSESRDQDLDGLPDMIERRHTSAPNSSTGLSPSAHLDGDGVPVLVEFYQGLSLTADDAGTEELILENSGTGVTIRAERSIAAVGFAQAEPALRADLGSLVLIASPTVSTSPHPSDPTKEIVEWEFQDARSRSFYQLLYDVVDD